MHLHQIPEQNQTSCGGLSTRPVVICRESTRYRGGFPPEDPIGIRVSGLRCREKLLLGFKVSGGAMADLLSRLTDTKLPQLGAL